MAAAQQLLLRIDGDFERLRQELAKAETATLKGAERMRQGLGEIDKSFAGLARQLRRLNPLLATFGVGLGAGALLGFGRQVLETIGNLGEQAEQLGVTTQSLQVYQFMATQAGASQEQLETGLARLTRTIGEAAEGNDKAIERFAALGVGILEAGGALRSTDAVLQDVARALAAIPDPAARAAAVVDLFGRTGQRLLPFLADLADGYDHNAARARALGVVVEDDVIKRFKAAADSFARLGRELVILAAGPVDFLIRKWKELGEAEEARRKKALQTLLPQRFAAEEEVAFETRRGEALSRFPRPPEAAALPESDKARAAREKAAKEAEALERDLEANAIQHRLRVMEAEEKQHEQAKRFLDDLARDRLRAAGDELGLIELKRKKQLETLDTLLLGERQFEDARRAINETATLERVKVDKERLDEATRAQEKNLQELEDMLGRSIDHTAQAFLRLGRDGRSAFESLRGIAAAVLDDIAEMFVRLAITNPIKNALLGVSLPTLASIPSFGFGAPTPLQLSGPFAKGGAFAAGAPLKFAGGGVFDRPSSFALGGGRLGLLGEAGPEAVMPLARLPSGELGVRAAGGAAGATVVVNQTFNVSAGVAQTVRAEMLGLLPHFERAAAAGVAARRKRGGDYAEIFQR